MLMTPGWNTGNCVIREVDLIRGVVGTVSGTPGTFQSADGTSQTTNVFPTSLIYTPYDGFSLFTDRCAAEQNAFIRQFHAPSSTVSTVKPTPRNFYTGLAASRNRANGKEYWIPFQGAVVSRRCCNSAALQSIEADSRPPRPRRLLTAFLHLHIAEAIFTPIGCCHDPALLLDHPRTAMLHHSRLVPAGPTATRHPVQAITCRPSKSCGVS